MSVSVPFINDDENYIHWNGAQSGGNPVNIIINLYCPLKGKGRHYSLKKQWKTNRQGPEMCLLLE